MQNGEQTVLLLAVLVTVALVIYHRKRRTSGAYGTAAWATDRALKAAGMLGDRGLILGRTQSGRVIRLCNYTHVLLVGGTGSGKGVSVVIPNLLTYPGSCVVNDTKRDLFETCGAVRRRMGRVIRLAPFGRGRDKFNILDLIQSGPLLIDQARAVAESLVPRKGTEHDEHWLDRAVQTITGLLTFVLLCFEGEERSLNTLQEIASNPNLIVVAADKLCQMGGIPARLGNQLKSLFDGENLGNFSREGSGIASTVARCLSFLDSELVSECVGRSTFGPADLRGAVTIFLEIPPEMHDSMRGLLRCWISMLVRMMGKGSEADGEVLFLLDEAEMLSCPALEEALIRGRSTGIRLLLAYQSDAQITSAFKDKQTLIYDNCSTHIYLAGGINSVEAADRLVKRIGEATIVTESGGESRSSQQGGNGEQSGSVSHSHNWNQISRPLLRVEELLLLHSDFLLCFVKDVPPITARRIRFFADPLFGTAKDRKQMHPLGWVLFLVGLGLFIVMLGGLK